MSRRTAIVEEEYDDPDDLSLPATSLPNTGTKGAILEALSDDEGDSSSFAQPGPGSSSPSYPQFGGGQAGASFGMGSAGAGAGSMGGGANTKTITDITPYKSWMCVYPIYIDAKRAYGTGERRIAREKSVWWPLSRDMAEAASRLGFGTLHEAQKSHPRDWENPGRVRVQFKKDGKLANPKIKTKKELLELISMQIQMVKPDNLPEPPYSTAADAPTEPAPPPTPSKGKQPASKTAGKGTTSGTSLSPAAALPRRSGKALPVPPAPHPPLANRVSPFSPALVSGVLIETIKAGMTAPDPGAGGPIGAGKGKRKVVRVRQ